MSTISRPEAIDGAYLTRSDPISVASLSSRRLLWLGVALIALVGLGLRLLGARGDLWLDEVWSIINLGFADSFDQIFWVINHDNNHHLNSAYLYLVGLDASPLAARGFSIVLGIAAIFAAAAYNLRHGKAAALVTALLFAVSYPMVGFGSEARGYSGLILFTVLALLFAERQLETGKYTLALGLVLLGGVLSHMTMLETMLAIVVGSAWFLWRREGSVMAVPVRMLTVFAPAFLFILPFAAVFLLGIWKVGYAVGGYEAFTVEDFAAGFGGVIRSLFGIPAAFGNWTAIAIACAAAAAVAYHDRSARSYILLIGIVLIPALIFLAQMPNLKFPRYFLVTGTFALLMAGDLLGRSLAAGGARRAAAGVLLCGALLGNAVSLSHFYDLGRGSYTPIVAAMTANGPATFGTGHDSGIRGPVQYYAERLGVTLIHVKPDSWCSQRPTWMIFDQMGQQAQLIAAVGCGLRYERVMETRFWGLSGMNWTLFRRLD